MLLPFINELISFPPTTAAVPILPVSSSSKNININELIN